MSKFGEMSLNEKKYSSARQMNRDQVSDVILAEQVPTKSSVETQQSIIRNAEPMVENDTPLRQNRAISYGSIDEISQFHEIVVKSNNVHAKTNRLIEPVDCWNNNQSNKKSLTTRRTESMITKAN